MALGFSPFYGELVLALLGLISSALYPESSVLKHLFIFFNTPPCRAVIPFPWHVRYLPGCWKYLRNLQKIITLLFPRSLLLLP